MKEYHPELLSRRGEIVAWGSGLLLVATWIFLVFTSNQVHRAIPFLTIFLLMSAIGISLGNWMDRNTTIKLFTGGIHYQNGLRNVTLDWPEISQVQVFPSNWGKKVRVLGAKAHFDFRTLGEVKVAGETKGVMGFLEGERILKQIIEKSEIKLVRQVGGSYYYARG